MVRSNEVFIPKTVVLETEWVLRGVYQLERGRVNAALKAFLSLERVVIEDESALIAALDSHTRGMDFADALHLASSQRSETFATLGSALKARAKKLMLLPPVTRL